MLQWLKDLWARFTSGPVYGDDDEDEDRPGPPPGA